MAIEKEQIALFPDRRNGHYLTGVVQKKRTPDNYHETDTRAESLAAETGRICERIALHAWSDPEFKVPPKTRKNLEANANLVRARLRPLQGAKPITEDGQLDPTRKELRVSDISPIYQSLTPPSAVPFKEDDKWVIKWKPLHKLMTSLDKIHGTNLVQDFISEGEDFPGSGTVSPYTRFIVERALMLERLTTEKPPFHIFGDLGVLVPDVRIPKTTQFDGLFVRAKNKIDSKKNLGISLFSGENLCDFGILEVKTVHRLRHTRNLDSEVDKGQFDYDLRATQEQIANVAQRLGGHMRLPDFIIYTYLRGTQPHAVHRVSLYNRGILMTWKMGIEEDRILMIDNQSPEYKGSGILLAAIEERLAMLTSPNAAVANYRLPKDKLSQSEMFDGNVIYTATTQPIISINGHGSMNIQKTNGENKKNRELPQTIKLPAEIEEKTQVQIQTGENNLNALSTFIHNLALHLESQSIINLQNRGLNPAEIGQSFIDRLHENGDLPKPQNQKKLSLNFPTNCLGQYENGSEEKPKSAISISASDFLKRLQKYITEFVKKYPRAFTARQINQNIVLLELLAQNLQNESVGIVLDANNGSKAYSISQIGLE